jgi:hypothetical protein
MGVVGSLLTIALGAILLLVIIAGAILTLMDPLFWRETVPEIFQTIVGMLAVLGLAMLFDRTRSR